MDLREYLAENRPLVLKEFEMYERRDQLPRILGYVRTIRSFNGLCPDTPLRVIGYRREDNRIILEDALGRGYTISKEFWYQEVYVVEESK